MDTVIGKIVAIKPTVQIKDTFVKREVWIEMPGTHPQTVSVEFVQGNVDLLDNFSIDDVVEVGYSLRGRIYNDRVFNSLQGYKIAVHGKPPVKEKKEDNGDLPF